jgi:predicted dienelactone hydrolase
MSCRILVVALGLSLYPAIAMSETGISIKSIEAAHHGRFMEMAVFYPGSGGKSSMLGDNAVFEGTRVYEGAVPESEKHPVVLMSHGWGGNFKRMAWLSEKLVAKGAVVIAVNHPNSTTGELQNLHVLDHWTRAQDLSVALDAVLADPLFAPIADPARIHAADFSYGGWTALSLGGWKGNRDGLEKFCTERNDEISHCADILKSGIRIDQIDKAKWEASYKDSRIVSVAAIDPALTWGVTDSSVADLNVPVLLIGVGVGDDRLKGTDTSIRGSILDGLISGAQVEVISPATHFTALGICKPAGAEILAEEKDDPVCADPEGTDRKQVTDRIADLISDHFKL